MEEAEIEVADHEANKSGELEDDEDKVAHAPTLILSRITWIGDQITKVSQAKIGIVSLILSLFLGAFTSSFNICQIVLVTS